VEDGEELDSIVCRAPGKQPIVHYFTKDGLYDGWAVQADPGMTDEECKQEVEQIEALQVKW
jgi:hypothetical protein